MPITPGDAARYDFKIIDKAIEKVDSRLRAVNSERGAHVNLDSDTTGSSSGFWQEHPSAVKAFVEAYEKAGWKVKRVPSHSATITLSFTPR